jgi:L-lactate dehydrogenase complex protein LldG
MSEAREQILGALRRGLRRGPLDAGAAASLEARLDKHARGPIPARAAALDRAAQRDLFAAMAVEVDATVARVAAPADIPAAVADYLAGENLPARLVMAPDPALDAIPWHERPLIEIRRGRAEAGDAVSLTPCFAAIAETGTLMLVSGPQTPTTLNFLPDTHIAVVHAGQVVATYEDGLDRLRAAGTGLPRTVNFVTGPSRTADIEQRLQLGAHGPRRLHIILVDDG